MLLLASAHRKLNMVDTDNWHLVGLPLSHGPWRASFTHGSNDDAPRNQAVAPGSERADPLPAESEQPLRLCFAAYMATSALSSKSCAVMPSPGCTAMPMLGLTSISVEPMVATAEIMR